MRSPTISVPYIRLRSFPGGIGIELDAQGRRQRGGREVCTSSMP